MDKTKIIGMLGDLTPEDLLPYMDQYLGVIYFNQERGASTVSRGILVRHCNELRLEGSLSYGNLGILFVDGEPAPFPKGFEEGYTRRVHVPPTG